MGGNDKILIDNKTSHQHDQHTAENTDSRTKG